MTPLDGPTELRVGADTANHVCLRPLRRSYPATQEFWDGNWLKVDLEVRAGAFRGRFEADLRCEEFERFAEQLAALQASGRGEALLETMEGWVSLRLVADQRGHLEGTCEVRDDPALGSCLRFGLTADLTHLPPMLAALGLILVAFPVVGQPDEADGAGFDGP